MPLLADDEIAAMRAAQAQTLPDTGTVQRKSASGDGKGGQTVSYANFATGVNCRLGRDAQAARPGVKGERIDTRIPWVITFAHDQDIRSTDRILIDGRTFEVINVEDHTEWMTALRVQCVEIV